MGREYAGGDARVLVVEHLRAHPEVCTAEVLAILGRSTAWKKRQPRMEDVAEGADAVLLPERERTDPFHVRGLLAIFRSRIASVLEINRDGLIPGCRVKLTRPPYGSGVVCGISLIREAPVAVRLDGDGRIRYVKPQAIEAENKRKERMHGYAGCLEPHSGESPNNCELVSGSSGEQRSWRRMLRQA